MKEKLVSFCRKVGRKINLCGLYFLKLLQKHYLIVAMALVTILAIVARYMVVTHPTNDTAGIVLRWMDQIREVGFTNYYTIDADYSTIFLFFIAIITLLPTSEMIEVNGYTFYKSDLVYLKSFYFIYTIALAIGVFLLVKLLTKSKEKAALAYIIALILPTVFINSAVWGNSDVVYGTLLVFSFYCLLTKRERTAFLLVGLAFGDKLQAVFILPFMAYLIFNRKLKVYKFIYAVIGMFITFLPTYICGASFSVPFQYISTQIGRYANLSLGCANFWHLIDFKGTVVSDGATWISLAIILVILIALYYRGIDLEDKRNMFKVGFFLIMVTVFFLPHMHERYFYLIDVLVLVYAFIDKKKFYFIPLMQISSLIAYFHYLAGYYFIDSWGEGSVNIAVFINIVILVITAYDLMNIEHDSGFIRRNKKIEEDISSLKE